MTVGQDRSSIVRQSLLMLCLVTSPAWIFQLFYGDPNAPPEGTEFAVVPLLICAAIVLIAYVGGSDGFLREVMFTGLLVRLAASAASLYMAFEVYNSSADSVHYASMGRWIAMVYQSTGTWIIAKPLWGIPFVYNVTSGLFILLGISMPMGTVFFSLVAFWGQYLLYRAFQIAFPKGDRRMAAMMIFLLPSIVYWTSSIGKDALALFFIGWSVYGFALLDRRRSTRAFLPLLVGLTGVLCVRPHVAGMLAIAFAIPYALGQTQGAKGIAVKVIGIPILVVVTVYFAYEAQVYLGMDDVSQASTVLHTVAGKTATGTSAFGSASLVARAVAAPLLFFRPFPFEVHNPQAAIACAEAMLLLWITWRLRRHIVRSLRAQWRNGFTLFLLLFLFEFSVIFSAAIANFGLLARERTMAIPLFAMLLCMVPQRVRHVARTQLLTSPPTGRTMLPATVATRVTTTMPHPRPAK